MERESPLKKSFYLDKFRKELSSKKLHEGDAKRYIEGRLGRNKNLSIQYHSSLLDSVIEHKDSEHLLNDLETFSLSIPALNEYIKERADMPAVESLIQHSSYYSYY